MNDLNYVLVVDFWRENQAKNWSLGTKREVSLSTHLEQTTLLHLVVDKVLKVDL